MSEPMTPAGRPTTVAEEVAARVLGADRRSENYHSMIRAALEAVGYADLQTMIDECTALAATVARVEAVHATYFDMDGEPGMDDTTPEPEDVWRYDRDLRAALRPRGEPAMSEITTAEELDALLLAVADKADYAIVRTPDRRPWIVWENDRGDFLACSPHHEDDGDTDSHYCDATQFPLPLTVVYRPDAPAGATVTREQYDMLVAAFTEHWREPLGSVAADIAIAALGMTVTDTPPDGGAR